VSFVAYQHSQSNVYSRTQPHHTAIYHNRRPTIVDTLLTLIFIMGQVYFDCLFCLWRQQIMHLWLCATYRPADYPRQMTKNCSRSVDTHYLDGAASVLHFVLPIEAANDLFMTMCNLVPCILPKIHDHESLTLHWRLFSAWGWEHLTFFFAYIGSKCLVLDYVQPIPP
jgi:hypothetical protein